MKSYNVKITDRAEKMMEKYLAHLVYEKQNMQAAIAVSDDYDETIDELETLTRESQCRFHQQMISGC